MAEVTERDREIADRIYYEDPDKDVVASQIAAYREEFVAEERAARQKAEARLRDVIEAADRAMATFEADMYGPETVCRAFAQYRKVRDAQASPEPEASKHGGRDAE